MAKKHVAVLYGGFSSERAVSLSSGESCGKALEEQGYKVTMVDVDRQVGRVLSELRPEVVFNALHGPYGEDGTVQGILEFLRIPYTHSGVMASALAMDKERSKIVAAHAGIAVAESVIVDRFLIGARHPMPPPYVIKPLREGSSFGVIIVREGQENPPRIVGSEEWRFGDMVMIERYVPGRELTCAVMGDEALSVCEIVPVGRAFYDYDSKYLPGGSRHVVPAEISPIIYQKVQTMALKAHRAMGCRGVTRSDFRFDDRQADEAGLIWLEINTQPGMTPTSLVPDMAAHAGYSFGELVKWMVEDASCSR